MGVRQDILDAMKTTLEATSGTGYPLDIAHVSLYDENVANTDNWKSPMAMILDGGTEELVVYDGTNYRYNWRVVLRGYIRTEVRSTVHTELNKMVATLKKYVNSGPSLGSNVLSFDFDGVETTRFDPDQNRADVIMNCRVLYWCVAGTF